MRGRFVGLGAALTIGVVVLVAAGQAWAGHGLSVSGTYVVSAFGDSDCTAVGASGFMFRCDTTGLVSDYSGDLTGSAVADFTSLINCKTEREVGHGTETFNGTIGDMGPGALTWTDQFSADVDCDNLFFPSNLDINSVAVRGSGAFAGLQGKLHFTDADFSGQLH